MYKICMLIPFLVLDCEETENLVSLDYSYVSMRLMREEIT